ncbi:MAG: protein kinase [Candidatus Competibacter sp.]|nr:protein kinase [Candidatus Competibacter sp.]MDG4585711.1 protein kinase [Candidatus Competibacter sp.]
MSFNGSSPEFFPESGQCGGSLYPPQSVQILGYEIEREIGRGGMATVYRAMQQSLGRQVAIKIMAQEPNDDGEFARRFKKEGRILAQLLHVNIVTIYDIGVSEHNQLYLSVEYLPGGTLKDRIRQGLSLDAVIEITRAIAKALGYAHERGVIHRDIKPSNIMFRQDGTPVLTDFGVARMLDSKTVFTASGLMIGSPGYMSPEQAMGEGATTQSDLYGLGVVLHEMLTGRSLYQADNPLALMLKHLRDPIPDLPKECAHLQPVLNKLLAKRCENRYKNTNELIEALDLIITSDAKLRPEWNLNNDNPDIGEPTNGKIWRVQRKRSRFFIWSSTVTVLVLLMAAIYTLRLKNFMEIENVEKLQKPRNLIEAMVPIQRKKEITAFLEQAETQLKNELLTDESAQSAETAYRQVLKLDPDNTQALAGLENIAKQYEQLARQRLQAGEPQESLNQIKRGLMIVPGHEGLTRLYQETEQYVTEQKARKTEQEQQNKLLQAEQFLTQAKKSFEEGLLEIGLAHIEQGLLAVPNHSDLLALREQLKSRVENQERQAEIQRRQEEARREADQYLAQALNYQRDGDYSTSLRQIEKGLAAVSNHNGLLRLQKKVRILAEQKRQTALRQSSKQTERQTTKSTAISPKKEDDAILDEIMEIKNAVDALDKSLGR